MSKNICLNCGYFLNCNFASENIIYCEKYVKVRRNVVRIEDKKEEINLKIKKQKKWRNYNNE